MQPLGNKILVRDIVEGEKKSEGGLILPNNDHYRKVTVIAISADSKTARYFDKEGNIVPLKPEDICLCNPGGVELEKGLWLCNENLLDCKL